MKKIILLILFVGILVTGLVLIQFNKRNLKQPNSPLDKTFSRKSELITKKELPKTKIIHQKDTNNITSLSQSVTLTVNKGFIFYYGKYIEIPYQISSDENTVRINGNIVFKIKTKVTTKVPISTEDPGIPVWVNKNTNLEKIIQDSTGKPAGLYREKWLYLAKTYPSEEAIKKFVAYMKSLPCIKKVDMETKINKEYYVSLTITSMKGEEMCLILSDPPVKYTKNTKPISSVSTTLPSRASTSERLGLLDDEKKRIVKSLELNQALFYFRDTGPSIGFGVKIFIQRFPLAESIIFSSLTEQEKIKQLQNLGFALGTKKFINNFQKSKQLDERLTELSKKFGITPITMEDLEKMETSPTSQPAK